MVPIFVIFSVFFGIYATMENNAHKRRAGEKSAYSVFNKNFEKLDGTFDAEQIDAHRKTQLAAHPDAALTATYNVLEKLRSGEALSAKDKTMHEQGLVSVLRTLHNELDAALLQAYGWSDFGPVPHQDAAARAAWTDALLLRLVDLNTRRAAEEATGTIRWLRPDYQNPVKPAQTSTPEQAVMDLPSAETPDSTDDADAPTSAAKPLAQQAWPATLPEQIKAVADILSAAPKALDLDTIAAHFKGRGRWRERLPVILDTLVAIGRAQSLRNTSRQSN